MLLRKKAVSSKTDGSITLALRVTAEKNCRTSKDNVLWTDETKLEIFGCLVKSKYNTSTNMMA